VVHPLAVLLQESDVDALALDRRDQLEVRAAHHGEPDLEREGNALPCTIVLAGAIVQIAHGPIPDASGASADLSTSCPTIPT
jgi:hypothetical protein